MKSILIDGDGFIYRCGFAVEKTRYLVWSEDLKEACFVNSHKEAEQVVGPDGFDTIWSRKELEPLENATKLLDIQLDKIFQRYKDYEDKRVILSPSTGNFRDALATFAKYKGNRDGQQRPKYYGQLLDHLLSKYVHMVRTHSGGEADDGIAEYAFRMGNVDNVVVSIDKDLDQIPGLHYNWVKETEYVVDKKQACINLYGQILAGDPTDNIPGIEGCGPKTAHKMLENCTSSSDCWKVVRDAYTSKYDTVKPGEGMKRAMETAQLIYLRKEGVDKPWNPPNN